MRQPFVLFTRRHLNFFYLIPDGCCDADESLGHPSIGPPFPQVRWVILYLSRVFCRASVNGKATRTTSKNHTSTAFARYKIDKSEMVFASVTSPSRWITPFCQCHSNDGFARSNQWETGKLIDRDLLPCFSPWNVELSMSEVDNDT